MTSTRGAIYMLYANEVRILDSPSVGRPSLKMAALTGQN
jgi:hypothetical protein